MYHKHLSRGIVISHRNEGNDSRRINILTEKFGLLNVRAQGVRNLHSKLKPGSEDFTLGEFSLLHGKSGWKLVGAVPQKNLYENLRKDNAKLQILANILNLVSKLADEEENRAPYETSLYSIVSNFINFLEVENNTESLGLAECLVLLRILNLLGYLRHDPDFAFPISSNEIDSATLEKIAPKRARMIALINESLNATNLG